MKSLTLPDMAKIRLPEPMMAHEIRLRAYAMYEQGGKVQGNALEDWLQSEAELTCRALVQDLNAAKM